MEENTHPTILFRSIPFLYDPIMYGMVLWGCYSPVKTPLYLRKPFIFVMNDFVARKGRNNDFKDRFLSMLNRGGEIVPLWGSMAASVACLLAVLLAVQLLLAVEKVVSNNERK